jgi:hypothetical protein
MWNGGEAARGQQVPNHALHIGQRRPNTVVELLYPRIDSNEAVVSVMRDGCSGKLPGYVDDV